MAGAIGALLYGALWNAPVAALLSIAVLTLALYRESQLRGRAPKA